MRRKHDRRAAMQSGRQLHPPVVILGLWNRVQCPRRLRSNHHQQKNNAPTHEQLLRTTPEMRLILKSIT
jgi:hypothetical protein